MIRGAWAKTTRLWLLALYALASLSIGFAHQPPQIPFVDLAQYAMADGTLPIICSGKGDRSGKTGAHECGCKACCLITAPGLPPSRGDQVDRRCSYSNGKLRISPVADLPPNPALPALGPRGPPLS